MKKLLISLSIFVLMIVGSYTEAAWYNGGTGYNYNYMGGEGSSYLSPSIRVISPNNGGESVEAGGKIEIRWESNVSTNLMVDVYVTNGVNRGSTIRALNTGALGVIYALDNSLPLGSNYRACVSFSAEPSVVDCSDLPFTIKSSSYNYNQSVKILSPNGGEVFTQGSSNRISWSGGKNKVQVGVASEDYTDQRGTLLGWIELNGLTNNYVVWDGRIIKDLMGNYLGTISPGRYKIVVVSEGLNSGNYCSGPIVSGSFGSTFPCNYDISDNYFTVNSSSTICPPNMPNPLSMCPNSTMVPDRYDSNGCVISYKCSNYIVDNGCPPGAIFSSITGQRCSSVTTVPSITVLSPNGGEVFVKKSINYRGDSFNYESVIRNVSSLGDGILSEYITKRNDNNWSLGKYYPLSNSAHYSPNTEPIRDSGSSSFIDDSYDDGEYYLLAQWKGKNGLILNDFSDRTFTIKSSLASVDLGCLYGARYSTITGKLCNNVINDNKIYRTLRWGDVGEDVKILQRYLGMYPDGVYGRGTVTKVKTWQRLNNIYPDGVFGNASRIKAGL